MSATITTESGHTCTIIGTGSMVLEINDTMMRTATLSHQSFDGKYQIIASSAIESWLKPRHVATRFLGPYNISIREYLPNVTISNTWFNSLSDFLLRAPPGREMHNSLEAAHVMQKFGVIHCTGSMDFPLAPPLTPNDLWNIKITADTIRPGTKPTSPATSFPN